MDDLIVDDGVKGFSPPDRLTGGVVGVEEAPAVARRFGIVSGVDKKSVMERLRTLGLFWVGRGGVFMLDFVGFSAALDLDIDLTELSISSSFTSPSLSLSLSLNMLLRRLETVRRGFVETLTLWSCSSVFKKEY